MSPKLTIATVCLINLATGLLVGLGVGRSWDGGPPGPPPPRGEPSQALARELGLDAAQTERVRVLMEAHRPEFEAVFARQREQMMALRDRFDAEMRDVLTPAQYEQLRAKRRELEARERRGPPGPPPRRD